jgi:glycosyltransferase involved in cell wall biosynthesis
VTESDLHFIVPGSLDQRTGGYIYDKRVVAGLRERSWDVTVHELNGEFPVADVQASASLAETLVRIPGGALVIIDGLAMGGLADTVHAQATRLRLLALIHHLLADETGLDQAGRADFLEREREALGSCIGVIVTSSFTAGRVRDIGIEPTLIATVRPGNDPAPPATGPGANDPPQLLCVASVTPRKGQDVLVHALARLSDVQWTCVCAGSLTRSPTFAETVGTAVRDAGLSGRIRFPGECDEDTLEALYATSSVFVLPSYFEGYGMVLTEAMARGLPIVTTNGGAIPDTVPSDAGIFVRPGDPDALAGALRSLLVDAPDQPHSARNERARLGTAARRYASGLPKWDEAVEAFAEAARSLGTSRA